MITLFIFSNLNLSFADSKSDLNTNLTNLTKVLDKIEKNPTKKVAKKQLKEVKKINKKLNKLNVNQRVKDAALDNASDVMQLCKDVKKEYETKSIVKLKIENYKVKIESTKTINKGIKGKKLAEVIRIQAARQINYQLTNFDNKVINVIMSDKEYNEDEFEKTMSETRNQISGIRNYFNKNKTNLDSEIVNATIDIESAMQSFHLGKYTVKEYEVERLKALNKIDKYAPFENFKLK